MKIDRRLPVLAVALALVASACGGGGDERFNFSVKELSLDLVFSEEELKVPVPPRIIVEHLPAPPEARVEVGLPPIEREAVEPLYPPCPEAVDGAIPEKRVAFLFDDPPLVGRYTRHNTGSLKLSGGAVNLSFPFPPRSTWVIPATEQVTMTSALGTETQVWEWDVEKRLFPGYTIVERMRLTAEALQLVKRTTITESGEEVFAPSPVIDVYRFLATGESWQSAGVDTETNTAMLWEALVEDREVIDVCGSLIDTWRFSVRSTMVNLTTGAVSGTVQGKRDIYNIAPQYFGQIVREELYQQQSTRTEDGIPLVLDVEYVSTSDGVEPRPIEEGT